MLSKQETFYTQTKNIFVDEDTGKTVFDEYYSTCICMFGIAYGITILGLFLILKEDLTTFQQNYSSLLYFIEFVSYTASLLIASIAIVWLIQVTFLLFFFFILFYKPK